MALDSPNRMAAAPEPSPTVATFLLLLLGFELAALFVAFVLRGTDAGAVAAAVVLLAAAVLFLVGLVAAVFIPGARLIGTVAMLVAVPLAVVSVGWTGAPTGRFGFGF